MYISLGEEKTRKKKEVYRGDVYADIDNAAFPACFSRGIFRSHR